MESKISALIENGKGKVSLKQLRQSIEDMGLIVHYRKSRIPYGWKTELIVRDSNFDLVGTWMVR